MLMNAYTSKVAVGLGMAALTSVLFTACSSLLNDHLLTGPQPSSQSQVQTAVDNVRIALEKSLGNTVPSLNLYIQTPNDIFFASSVPAGATPFTENTYFRFASNTKTFTSTAILNMQQDGWLNIKAKITDNIPGTNTPYVPNTPEWDFPNKDQITIEQLLQHSAGIYDVDNSIVPDCDSMSYTAYTQSKYPTHQFTADELVYQLVKYKLKDTFSPGKGYHYSNTGYTILGYIIARVYQLKTGLAKTYGDYLQDRIVGPGNLYPLLLYFPSLASDTKMPSPYAPGVERHAGKAPLIFTDYNMSAQVAEGNGYGTPASLNTFIRTLMKGQNVLYAPAVELMQRDTNTYSKGREYALGCFFQKNLGYGHNGERCGTLSLMAYDPATDVSVVAFINLVDKTRGEDSDPNSTFAMCFNAISDAAYAGRAALGYPGKP